MTCRDIVTGEPRGHYPIVSVGPEEIARQFEAVRTADVDNAAPRTDADNEFILATDTGILTIRHDTPNANG